MSGVKIAQGEWVLVCDGAKALVLENIGDEKFPNLKTKEVYQQDAPKTHEQGTDAPGPPSTRLMRDAAPWSRPTGTTRPSSVSCKALPVISTRR
jgi:protein required for attachment to host cells